MLLLLDNYDSFTYNLKDYFEQLGEVCIVVRNDELTIEQLKQLKFNKIVLSPGPERPETAGIMNEVIATFHTDYPILGICLGHQALGQFFGAKLEKAKCPMHGKVSEIKHNRNDFFASIPANFKVCRYHSLLLKDFEGTPLKNIAESFTGENMAIQHESLPLWGVQFHPEAILTQYGIQLLKNWLNLLPTLKPMDFE